MGVMQVNLAVSRESSPLRYMHGTHVSSTYGNITFVIVSIVITTDYKMVSPTLMRASICKDGPPHKHTHTGFSWHSC